MNKLLVICGPTATGKTALALSLAERFHGELISADSRQVYRGMDIGTGKEKVPGVHVWLYDVVNPDQEFSVSHFRKLATSAIADIRNRGKLPIVVGGTGLYIKSLISPMETASIPPNRALRKKLAQVPLEELQTILSKEGPLIWKNLNFSDRQNPRRLIRKIEIVQSSRIVPGVKKSVPFAAKEDVLLIGLTAPLPTLYRSIDARVDKRVHQGIEAEIRGLLSKGYTWDLPAMNTLGYKEFREGFSQAAIQRWKFDEHAYARRQLTWFKKQKDIAWFDVGMSSYERQVTEKVASWYTQMSEHSGRDLY